MERAELVELLSPEGLRLLDSLPPYESAADVVRMVSALRSQGHPPGLVATVLTGAKGVGSVRGMDKATNRDKAVD